MPDYPAHYYDRFAPNDNYDRHLFLAGSVIQSAEFNELQSFAEYRHQLLSDALMSNGDVLSGATVVIDDQTGATTIEAGNIYLGGRIREVPTGSLTISVTGTVVLGVYLVETIVTKLEDAALGDPAVGLMNYQEPGAQRLQVAPVWGKAGDGQGGEFYPVYTVIDGQVIPQNPPPNFSAIADAIAQYDRNSAGGYYVVDGMDVIKAADSGSNQVYLIQSGKSQVNGRLVSYGASRRILHAATPNLSRVTGEPHTSATVATQRIDTNNGPVSSVVQALIVAEKTVDVAHGPAGGIDDLPDETVLSVVSLTQGGTTYIEDVDFELANGNIDWALAGSEPASGSLYTITYTYQTAATVESEDETGFSVTGALVGTQILVTYDWKLPRWDRLCLLQNGMAEWVVGVAEEVNPQRPQIPAGRLLLASVYQSWDTSTRVVNDAVRVVPMDSIDEMRMAISDLYDLMSLERLRSDVALIEPNAKHGVFVDAFMDNAMRDAGIEQEAVTVGGELTLPMDEDGLIPDQANTTDETLPVNLSVSDVQQTSRTGEMKINPYQTVLPLPADVEIVPSRDVHIEEDITWKQPIIRRALSSGSNRRPNVVSFMGGQPFTPSWNLDGTWTVPGNPFRIYGSRNTRDVRVNAGNQILSEERRSLETLHVRTISFTIRHFNANESLTSVMFSGIDVTP